MESPLLLFLSESAPENRTHAKKRKHLRRNRRALDTLWLLAGERQIVILGMPGNHVFKTAIACAPFAKVRRGGASGRHTLRYCRAPDEDEFAGIFVRHRLQQNSVDYGKDSGVCADAQRESEYRDRGERLVPRQRARPVAQILQNGLHRSLLVPTLRAHQSWLVPVAFLAHRYGSVQFRPELVGSDAGFLGFFHDAAVEEVDGALGEIGVALVVRDHADGGAVAVQVAQELHDRFAVLGVQVSRGLVSHQDERIADQRAGHSDTLLLTAGELRRVVAQAMGHADALERALHLLLALARAGAAIGERELHVFVHGEIADQVEGLKDEADLAVANARALADG